MPKYHILSLQGCIYTRFNVSVGGGKISFTHWCLSTPALAEFLTCMSIIIYGVGTDPDQIQNKLF